MKTTTYCTREYQEATENDSSEDCVAMRTKDKSKMNKRLKVVCGLCFVPGKMHYKNMHDNKNLLTKCLCLSFFSIFQVFCYC